MAAVANSTQSLDEPIKRAFQIIPHTVLAKIDQDDAIRKALQPPEQQKERSATPVPTRSIGGLPSRRQQVQASASSILQRLQNLDTTGKLRVSSQKTQSIAQVTGHKEAMQQEIQRLKDETQEIQNRLAKADAQSKRYAAEIQKLKDPALAAEANAKLREMYEKRDMVKR